MSSADNRRLTNHEKLKVSLTNHVGKTLKTEDIWQIVSAQHSDFRKGSNLPNDHSDVGNQSACTCAGTERRIFNKVKHGHYYVVDLNLDANIINDINDIETLNVSEATKKALVNARIGQGKFRQDLLEYWGEKCALTSSNLIEILKASHIKPWSKCQNNGEKLDRFNGLLLCPNLDSVFDRGLISFDADGRILISKLIDTAEYIKLGLHENLSICKSKLTEKHQYYLHYHRTNLFRSD